jgi:hypothetical protein
MTALIYFRCRSAAHETIISPTSQPTSPITWHDGQWAYCPTGAAVGHDWERVAGASLAELRSKSISEVRARPSPVFSGGAIHTGSRATSGR